MIIMDARQQCVNIIMTVTGQFFKKKMNEK